LRAAHAPPHIHVNSFEIAFIPEGRHVSMLFLVNRVVPTQALEPEFFGSGLSEQVSAELLL
jgi:hypothetical protein